jgi:hypothetical protein
VRGASPENTIMSSLSEKSKGLRLSRLEICVSVIYSVNKFAAIHSSKLISGTLLPVLIQVFLKRNYKLPCWICGKHGGGRQIKFFHISSFQVRATRGGGSSVMAVNTCIHLYIYIYRKKKDRLYSQHSTYYTLYHRVTV